VSQSCAYKKIKFVEEELIKSQEFRLEGKMKVREEKVIIDVTESAIERPKKTEVIRSYIIQAIKRAIV
jgi:hypothetical protein